MPRRLIALCLTLAGPALSLPVRPALAQDASDSAAYLALTQTPLGGLPPVFDLGVTGERARTVAVRTRYGLMSLDTHEYTHNFGVGLDIPVGSVSVGLTAGYHWPDCRDEPCHGHLMASLGLSENLVAVPLGARDASGTFAIGLDAELGVAGPGDSTVLAGKAVIPFALVPGKRDLRFVPYVAPGLGVGLVRADSTEAGLLFTFGAGVGLILPHELRLNAGIQRVFLRGGNWLVGVDLAIGGRR